MYSVRSMPRYTQTRKVTVLSRELFLFFLVQLLSGANMQPCTDPTRLN